MSKSPPSGKTYTIGRDSKTGTFTVRNPPKGTGTFVVMGRNKFEGAVSKANTVLREETGKFVGGKPRGK